MSLLDRGNATVVLRPRVPVDDGYGGTQPGPGTPVTMRVTLSPASTENDSADGWLVSDEYAMSARTLPDEIYDVQWDGNTWMPDGEVRQHNGPARVAHRSVAIKRRP